MDDAEIRLKCLALAKELFPAVSADAEALVVRAQKFYEFVVPWKEFPAVKLES